MRFIFYVFGSMFILGYGGRIFLSGSFFTFKLSFKIVCRVIARMRLSSGYVGWGDKIEFFKVFFGCLFFGR